MDLGLRGKVAIVAASSRGMGRATAMGLAAEGARVTMLARTGGSWTRRPRRSGRSTARRFSPSRPT